jgi:RNA polymerase sigma-70 factor, ECF subfamily
MESQKELIEAFKTYNKAIYNYIYFRTNRQKEVAEDLTQEVFLKVWAKREQFDQTKSKIKNWLFVIAHNIVIDYYRKKKDIVIDYEVQENWETPDNTTESLNNELLSAYVLKKMDELNATEKEIIILRFIEDLEISEIAEIIGKKYSATKVFLHRSLLKLKQILNADKV